MTGTMGGAISRPDDFNTARWERIGADPKQLDHLRKQFNELDYDARVAENLRIASLPDGELASSMRKLPPVPDVVPAAQPPTSPTDAGLPAGASE